MNFEMFWLSYPKKIGKKTAQKSWVKQNLDAKIDFILHALDMQKNHWQNPKFIPHPTTWLNGERWNDEMEVIQENIAESEWAMVMEHLLRFGSQTRVPLLSARGRVALQKIGGLPTIGKTTNPAQIAKLHQDFLTNY